MPNQPPHHVSSLPFRISSLPAPSLSRVSSISSFGFRISPDPSGRIMQNEPNLPHHRLAAQPKKAKRTQSTDRQHPKKRNEPNFRCSEQILTTNDCRLKTAFNKTNPIPPRPTANRQHPQAAFCETNPIHAYQVSSHPMFMRNEPNSHVPPASPRHSDTPTDASNVLYAKRTQFLPGPRPKCAKRTQSPPSPPIYELRTTSYEPEYAKQTQFHNPNNQKPTANSQKMRNEPNPHVPPASPRHSDTPTDASNVHYAKRTQFPYRCQPTTLAEGQSRFIGEPNLPPRHTPKCRSEAEIRLWRAKQGYYFSTWKRFA